MLSLTSLSPDSPSNYSLLSMSEALNNGPTLIKRKTKRQGERGGIHSLLITFCVCMLEGKGQCKVPFLKCLPHFLGLLTALELVKWIEVAGPGASPAQG